MHNKAGLTSTLPFMIPEINGVIRYRQRPGPKEFPLVFKWAESLKNRSKFGTVFVPEEKIMNIKEDIRPISYIKANAAEILE